jgi:hypothetical protein
VESRFQDVKPQTQLLVIVRRGATERFRRLQVRLADEPVRVVWDRRGEERRQSLQPVAVERRRRERRGPPSTTWRSGDFVLTRAAPATGARVGVGAGHTAAAAWADASRVGE